LVKSFEVNILKSKKKRLLKLRSDIIDECYKEKWIDTWFFPEYKGIKGYLGTQSIIFIGLNPSYTQFPDKYCDFFYKQLKQNGFQNAHITDIVKIRQKNRGVNDIFGDKNVMEEQIDFLLKEFEIIKPKIIVALGNRCYYELKKYVDGDLNIVKIRHYSSIRFPKNIRLLSREMKEIKKIMKL
jgi:hypothetical protein